MKRGIYQAALIFLSAGLILAACSIHIQPGHKRGGIIVIEPPRDPEIKPMPDQSKPELIK